MDKILEWFKSTGESMLGRVLTFALIVVVGLIVIKIVMMIINRALKRSKLERAAHSLIRSVALVVMYALLGFIAFSAIGIDVTGAVALASVISLALSLAMQNALANIIGGFTLLYTHPFHSGDWVEIAGQAGTVKEIGMAYTKLTTADNKLVQIPNSNVVESEIVNYTATGTRRISIDISCSYFADPEKVIKCLREAADVELRLDEPPIFATLTGYSEGSASYTVRVWCKSSDYWTVNFAVMRNIKTTFDREGIEMSYTKVNVKMDK